MCSINELPPPPPVHVSGVSSNVCSMSVICMDVRKMLMNILEGHVSIKDEVYDEIYDEV